MASDGYPTCYGPNNVDGKPIAYDSIHVPCYTGNSTHPYAPCCTVGSICLEGNICQHQDESSHTYYTTATCTDPDYADTDTCNPHCLDYQYSEVAYNRSTTYWYCCADDCTDPGITEQWNDIPEPTQLIAYTTLAPNLPPSVITAEALSASIPLVSLALTNRPAFSTILTDSLSGYWPSSWTELPSLVQSGISSGISTPASADIYTGPAALAITQAGAVRPPNSGTAISTPIPANHSSSNADVLGPAIGVPLGVLLIAAIIGFLLFRRRKNRRQAGALAAKNSPSDTPPRQDMSDHSNPSQYTPSTAYVSPSIANRESYYSSPPQGHSSYPGYQYAPMREERGEGLGVHEVQGEGAAAHEVQGSGATAYELPGVPVVPQELDAGGHGRRA